MLGDGTKEGDMPNDWRGNSPFDEVYPQNEDEAAIMAYLDSQEPFPESSAQMPGEQGGWGARGDSEDRREGVRAGEPTSRRFGGISVGTTRPWRRQLLDVSENVGPFLRRGYEQAANAVVGAITGEAPYSEDYTPTSTNPYRPQRAVSLSSGRPIVQQQSAIGPQRIPSRVTPSSGRPNVAATQGGQGPLPPGMRLGGGAETTPSDGTPRIRGYGRSLETGQYLWSTQDGDFTTQEFQKKYNGLDPGRVAEAQKLLTIKNREATPVQQKPVAFTDQTKDYQDYVRRGRVSRYSDQYQQAERQGEIMAKRYGAKAIAAGNMPARGDGTQINPADFADAHVKMAKNNPGWTYKDTAKTIWDIGAQRGWLSPEDMVKQTKLFRSMGIPVGAKDVAQAEEAQTDAQISKEQLKALQGGKKPSLGDVFDAVNKARELGQLQNDDEVKEFVRRYASGDINGALALLTAPAQEGKPPG